MILLGFLPRQMWLWRSTSRAQRSYHELSVPTSTPVVPGKSRRSPCHCHVRARAHEHVSSLRRQSTTALTAAHCRSCQDNARTNWGNSWPPSDEPYSRAGTLPASLSGVHSLNAQAKFFTECAHEFLVRHEVHPRDVVGSYAGGSASQVCTVKALRAENVASWYVRAGAGAAGWAGPNLGWVGWAGLGGGGRTGP